MKFNIIGMNEQRGVKCVPDQTRIHPWRAGCISDIKPEMRVGLIVGKSQRVPQFWSTMLLSSKIIRRNHHDFKSLNLAPKPKCCTEPGWCNYLYGDGRRKNGCTFPEAHRETEQFLSFTLLAALLSSCLLLAHFVRERMDIKPDTRVFRRETADDFSH
ncbi:hypothetical protein Btru_078002 [Bulinus truncatus]|nr:hypothetical protein Btru_078002 [Bulinus truncatus]